MTATKLTPASRLAATWERLHRRPGGKWLFSRLLGRFTPYTGTIGARVEDLGPGYARISMRDRPAVRNHLNSIHAIALANLGEVTSGLAMQSTLPPDVRGIVTGLDVEYIRKARGTLVAESRCTPPVVTGPTDAQAVAEIRNADGELVTRVTARWRLAPL